ncbi:DUF4345 family protein [Rhodoferax sp. TS-BS-61-7]|uniref:DUF4345 family protein n=1 Tax=Rhodoferax sp. TS-BS-61-7 TaxID=2094194 RepID=UPI000CF66983|nr:DUF4345 family protein [Rhodoferax sp. TS-BS-61-7]PQA78010.1 hypothetical protein C5F53_06635 [Rhodoferax sp. TS-BS-61-7]
MIYSDLLRQVLLASTALIFVAFAGWALLKPDSLAKVLGYQLSLPNGASEFGAIYVGVFLAQALLFAFALFRVHDAIIGDICAVFLLAQPLGRIMPMIAHGAPNGMLKALVLLEIFGAVALLSVRPLP